MVHVAFVIVEVLVVTVVIIGVALAEA
jgi:hypothetical protein